METNWQPILSGIMTAMAPILAAFIAAKGILMVAKYNAASQQTAEATSSRWERRERQVQGLLKWAGKRWHWHNELLGVIELGDHRAVYVTLKEMAADDKTVTTGSWGVTSRTMLDAWEDFREAERKYRALLSEHQGNEALGTVMRAAQPALQRAYLALNRAAERYIEGHESESPGGRGA